VLLGKPGISPQLELAAPARAVLVGARSQERGTDHAPEIENPVPLLLVLLLALRARAASWPWGGHGAL